MRKTVLHELLTVDGIELPAEGGADKLIECFSPHHTGEKLSLSVNVATGRYQCHGCGITGDAYTYLTEIRALSAGAAADKLKMAGATEEQLAHFRAQAEAARERREGLPKIVKEPYETLGDEFTKLAEHDYVDPTGRTIFRVVRYKALRADAAKEKSLPFTLRDDGQWWVSTPASHKLPDGHRLSVLPIYNLQEIAAVAARAAARADATKWQIWIVDDERTADAIAKCSDIPKGQLLPPTTCLYGVNARTRLDHHDVSPLYGQRVLLVASASSGSRTFMKKLGRHLSESNCECRYLLPDGDDDYGVGDAVAKRGWQGVLSFVDEAGGVQDHETALGIEAEEPTVSPMADTQYFRVLGLGPEETIVLQSKVTFRLHRITASRLTSEGSLIYIAPLAFWRSLAPNAEITPKARASWADSIIRAAEDAGEIEPNRSRMWRRGAMRTREDEVRFNLGDGVLYPDATGELVDKRGLLDAGSEDHKEIFLPGPAIRLRDNPDAARYARDMYDAVLRYRWEDPSHGRAFLGWLVTSLIGGALPFRPMLWMTAPSETGKTFVLEWIVQRFFGDLVSDLASATEAGMAAIAEDSALPCFLDEFEPMKGNEQRVKGILSLMRIATSGDSARIRGTSTGGVTITRPRFSLLLSSVDRPELEPQDKNRITPIRLAKVGVDDWPAVRKAILAATSRERSEVIHTYIIRNTLRIVRKVQELEDKLTGEGMSSRTAQIRAALTAGVWLLSGAEAEVTYPVRDRTEVDLYAPVSALFSALVRFGPQKDEKTLAEVLHHAWFDHEGKFIGPAGNVNSEPSLEVAQRYGFRFIDADTLWMARRHDPIRRLMERTPHANLDIDEYVRRLPGVERLKRSSGQPVRMRCGGVQRGVLQLPRSMLEAVGFFGDGEEVGAPAPAAPVQDSLGDIPF